MSERLSDIAKHLVLPEGITSTGWPAVRQRCASLGIGFDGWQDDLGASMLAKRKGGLYAAGIDGVQVSIPRQVGKTYTVGWMIFALCMNQRGLTAVWTAHRTRTADETFKSMKAMAARPPVVPFVRAVRSANGQQEVEFTNDSRILFGARESGFGRGFAGVDVLVFDEAQILGARALDDMVPATNTSPNPLIVRIGTPPKPTDPSEAFAEFRYDALEGRLTDGLYVELGADDEASSDDRAQWRRANPSFPHRTPEGAILRMKRQLGDESFRREGLGIWDTETFGRAISADLWSSTAVTEPPAGGIRSFGVAFSLDGSRQAVAGAIKAPDGTVHVELIDAQSGNTDAGVAALADWLAERWRDTAMIGISGRAGGAALQDELKRRRVPPLIPHTLNTAEYFAACALFMDGLKSSQATHPEGHDTDILEASVAVCDQRMRGSAWGWEATTEDGDETPLEAVSVALWAARTSRRKPRKREAVGA